MSDIDDALNRIMAELSKNALEAEKNLKMHPWDARDPAANYAKGRRDAFHIAMLIINREFNFYKEDTK